MFNFSAYGLFIGLVMVTGLATAQPLEKTDAMNVEETRRNPLQLLDSPCGKEDDYCEHVPGYPTEVVDRILLKYNTEFKELDRYNMEVNQRFNEKKESNLCSSEVKFVLPHAIKKNGWKTVVNTENFTQQFTVEKCTNEGSSCSADVHPLGYTLQCEQKYMMRKILLVTNENEPPHVEEFNMPSCCTCVLNENLASRFGKIIESIKKKW